MSSRNWQHPEASTGEGERSRGVIVAMSLFLLLSLAVLISTFVTASLVQQESVASKLRLIQTVGFGLALLNFLVFLMLSARRGRSREARTSRPPLPGPTEKQAQRRTTRTAPNRPSVARGGERAKKRAALPPAETADGAAHGTARGAAPSRVPARSAARRTPPRPLSQEGQSFVRQLTESARLLAEELGKRATIVASDFDLGLLPAPYRSRLSEILGQMVSNALVHGIEGPTERLDLGKHGAGRIEIRLESSGDGEILNVFVHDDGRGIQLPAIRERLVEAGRYTPRQAARLTPNQLVACLFEANFSLRGTSEEKIGSGMGLDRVLSSVKEMGGKLRVTFAEGRYSEFSISLPSRLDPP